MDETTGVLVAVTLRVDQLGNELRRKRSELGLTLREAETESGISAATLSRIERGSIPEVTVIEKLAKFLDVNVQAAGEESQSILSDEDLKKTIFVHLRAKKKLPEKAARSIADLFDTVMRLEMDRLGKQSK